MEKRKIMIIVAIIAIIVAIVIINNKKKDSNTTVQEEYKGTTNPIATKKTNEKFEMYNTKIETDSGETKVTATIKNITAGKTEEENLTIVLLDKSGKEIGNVIAIIPSLESKDSTIIVAENLTVFENVYDFKIK